MQKISVIAAIAKSFHGGIDDPAGIFRSLTCEMEIDHGGLEGGMSHVPLDDSRVHTGLEKVGGIAVPEGVNRDAPFGDTGSGLGLPEGPLGTVESHIGVFAVGPSFPPRPRAGKMKTGFLWVTQ